MRKLLIYMFLIFLSFSSYAQEQPFRTGFRFSPFLINTPNKDSLFLIQERSKKVISQLGYLEKSLEKILTETDSAYLLYKHKKNPEDAKGFDRYNKGAE